MLHTNLRPWLALGVIPLALTLTGCFGGPSAPTGGSPESDSTDDDLVEEIVEGAGDDVDFEVGALPADFPADDIPLIEGEIQQGMSVSEGQAWIVYIAAADQATAESADDLLAAAGFSNDSVIGWENGEYLVVAIPEESDDGWVVYYQVQVQQ